MFTKARIKLTAWYLLMIMTISFIFSAIIYNGVSHEIERGFRVQQMRIEQRGNFPPRIVVVDSDLLTEIKMRIKLNLLLVNLIIVGVSGAAGYFLSGRTLRPIKEMVDEQNRFIADASHELRTPLTALTSEIEVSLRDKGLNLGEAKKLLKSNLEEVNSLSKLADGLIRLAAYQKGANSLEFKDLVVTKIFAEATKKVTALAQKKKIVIERKTDQTTFRGDEVMITELVVIFLDNAIKYSPPGSKIVLMGRREDGEVVMTVADQGGGINEADLPHLFERFYRSEKSRSKSQAAGYGLGLAIAKEIVERHHGSIKVVSTRKKGSIFTIRMPL